MITLGITKDACGMPTDCPDDGPTYEMPSTRARLSNHKDMLPGLDGRSAGARRFRDLIGAYVADLGGISNCSEVKIGLLRRLAAASVLAEALEAKAVDGGDIDVSVFCNLASTTVRIASRLGLERVQRNVIPGLAEYLPPQREEAET
jgi:hypothetical protein